MAGVAVCVVMLTCLPHQNPARQGQNMLFFLSYILLAFCLLAGGFPTADCVSSEKREGTLGLLFLTPLTGMDIVLGKMACHSLQLGYGVCAVFPVFFLPLLIGGVTWAEVSRIALALGLALLLSASAGMAVSVMGTEAKKTAMKTVSIIVFITVIPLLYLFFAEEFFHVSVQHSRLLRISPIWTVCTGFDAEYRLHPGYFWSSAAILAGLSFILITASGCLLTPVFRRSGKSPCPARRRPSVSPAALQSNPYTWLVLRSADKGHGILFYCLIVFFAAMLLVALFTNHVEPGFVSACFSALAVHALVKLKFALEATKQVHSDRQSGALELLFATPLSDQAMQSGYHQAVRKIGRNSLLVLVCLNLALQLSIIFFPKQLHMTFKDGMVFSVLFIGGIGAAALDFAALRWLALFHGLRASSHLKAAMHAYCSLMPILWAAFGIMMAIMDKMHKTTTATAVLFGTWFLLGFLADWLAIRYCRTRLAAGIRRMISERH